MSEHAVLAHEVHVHLGDAHVLSNISLEIAPGAFVALLGPNGAGKSTFIHALLGLAPVTAGTLEIYGHTPGKQPRTLTGYIPQSTSRGSDFPATVIELVATGIRGAWPYRITIGERERALHALDRVGLADFAARSLHTLSGGERQRAYLARCFAKEPKLLLLDEPAANLDIGSAAQLYHLLEHYQKETGATVLMVTHDWEGARVHASQVMLFDDGRAQLGSPEDLASESRLLAAFGHRGHLEASHDDA